MNISINLSQNIKNELSFIYFISLIRCSLILILIFAVVIIQSHRKMFSKLQAKKSLFEGSQEEELLQRLERIDNGSLDKRFYVKAKHHSSDDWLKARILANRLVKNFDTSKTKTPQSFEYYIHFQHIDKRNDCWKNFKDLQATAEQVFKPKQPEFSLGDLHPYDNPHYGLSPYELSMHEKITLVKSVEKIQLGCFKTDAWYYSPYPPQYHNVGTLYICQFCLNFYACESQLIRHDKICPLFHPPGDEIYRDEQKMISVFQIDGAKSQIYCQNLGYLSKLFLDHKNLKNQMRIFLFYVLCQIKDNEYHIAGYFSKVKDSIHNLSCILILPFYQRKGYGKFMINFSYEISRIEKKIGGPEKPLSDLGRQTYLSYWTQKIYEVIVGQEQQKISIQNLSKETLITEDEIKWTLAKSSLIKYSKGDSFIFKPSNLSEKIEKMKKSYPPIHREKLHFVPYRKHWYDEKDSNQSKITEDIKEPKQI